MTSEPIWHHQIRDEGDRQTVVLDGELDLNAVQRLTAVLQAAISRAPVVHVDTAAVTFMDSTVINALLIARSTATAAGRRFAVINPSSPVRRVLSITGVLDILTGDSG